jgi:hypothetical protein
MTKTASNIGVPVAWTYLPLLVKVYHIISKLVKGVFQSKDKKKAPFSSKEAFLYI